MKPAPEVPGATRQCTENGSWLESSTVMLVSVFARCWNLFEPTSFVRKLERRSPAAPGTRQCSTSALLPATTRATAHALTLSALAESDRAPVSPSNIANAGP